MTRAFVRRSLAGIGAASLLLAFAGQALAEEPSAPAVVSAAAPSRDAVMAIVLGAQPVDPARLALGRRLILAIHDDKAMARATPVLIDAIRRQTLAEVRPDASGPLRTAFTAAVDETLAGGLEADLHARLMARLARYYAVGVDGQRLADAVEFYESPLGRKAVVGDDGWSEADRQVIGEYARLHADVIMVGVAHDPLNALDAIMAQETQALLPTFKQRLCANLKRRRVTLSSCAS